MRKRLSNSELEQMKTAYATGRVGLRELARNMNIPAGTILSRAKRDGWSREIQSAKALAKRQDASLAVTPLEAVSMSMQQRGERHVERMAGVSENVVSHVESLEPGAILDRIDAVEKADRIARRTFRLDDIQPGGISLNVLSINGDMNVSAS